jgi:hypothetical protein
MAWRQRMRRVFSVRTLMTNSLAVLRALNLKVRGFTSRVAQSAAIQRHLEALRIDPVNYDANGCESLCLTATDIRSRTEIVASNDVSFPSPPRCYHEA